MAPEIIKAEDYNFETDIWSLGVLYYRMLFGVYPFQKGDIETMKTEPYKNLSVSEKCNKDSANFISSCLRFNPTERIDWDHIMRHPIMWDNNLDDILFREYPIARSGVFLDHDEEVLHNVFEQPNDDLIRDSSILKKLLILRKRVVIYDALFLDFTGTLIGHICEDRSQDAYQHRQCLIPLLIHALFHMMELMNLLKNKNLKFTIKIE